MGPNFSNRGQLQTESTYLWNSHGSNVESLDGVWWRWFNYRDGAVYQKNVSESVSRDGAVYQANPRLCPDDGQLGHRGSQYSLNQHSTASKL